ncbi:hypothetical protein ARMA_1520 [Ardenticatena maritima]|uniref:YprB ribonuclease H-like domain-containing protein n=1 Tax=Ardenticatena maritima TaxID=872965 RepID=A0A0M9UCQ3_9CHLR|nr:ribonuclease H-like domain-containing protein [Ardenticatena maritima]GAP63097.1 hypothetical protein ARMA_1520 [Ardenticatena maritima]
MDEDRRPLPKMDVNALRARLNTLRGRHAPPAPAAPSPSETPPAPVEEVLGLQPHTTEAGVCLVRETRLPLSTRYGVAPLAELQRPHGERIARLLRAPAWRTFDFRQALFLDTETNGLAGGTGTFAFLVGVGFLDDDAFVVRQFFLRHPGEEPAMLAALQPLLERFDTFVTFNGKSFDIPLLETRFVLARRPLDLRTRPHLDLLHPARRIWRWRLTHCDLGTLERQVLGVRRAAEDVPGWLVPRYYNDYLRTGNAAPLRGVFYHNRHDIVALAALSVHMATIVADASPALGLAGADLFGVARLLEEGGHWDEAEAVYRRALQSQLPHALRREALKRLSLLFKRRQRWEEAAALWRAMLAQGDLFPYEELAKYLEHHARNLPAALAVVQRAFHDAREGCLRLNRAEREALLHRLARLQRKMEQANTDE